MLRTCRLLIPALIPSWRFFETVAPSPRIEFRANEGEWQPFQPRPQSLSPLRMLGRMVWNANWNAQLYCVSLSERLVAEPSAHSLNELNRRLAEELPAEKAADELQFRLIFVTREGARIVTYVEYESTPIKLSAAL